ncbi:2'-5' RNA ligase family protein [Haloglomus salinum]|uniref:2'-5' RNA ligase family protein n=1 Tax=Haloglomus salinum TaxID=2962673 RepID=UPI0020C9D7A5|nr:2'-5' RNA ligase family protein [Haloglomus salinum]
MAIIVGPTLPEPYFERVEAVWDDLVDRFGIDRYVNPYPHVTLYGLEASADVDAVVAAAERVAAEHDPFTVRTSGLGTFPGYHVYIPVAKSPALLHLHEDTVDALAPLGDAPTEYYEPDGWFPHVGLALSLDHDLAGEVVGHLLEREFAWTFTVDNVSVTRPAADGGTHELVATIDL